MQLCFCVAGIFSTRSVFTDLSGKRLKTALMKNWSLKHGKKCSQQWYKIDKKIMGYGKANSRNATLLMKKAAG